MSNWKPLKTKRPLRTDNKLSWRIWKRIRDYTRLLQDRPRDDDILIGPAPREREKT